MTTPRQPGWYDDPNDANAQRYWDGQDWTPHRQRKPISGPAQPSPPPPPPPPSNSPPPPPPPTANVPPPPPTAAKSPRASRVSSGAIKVGLVLAGLALVLVIAALVAGRVKFGTFLPGILVVAAIAAIGAFFVLRSRQSGLRKAAVVTAIVLVIAAAIPASSKVVYPVYNRYFGQKGGQASGAGTAGSGAGAPSGGAPQASPGAVKSGILALTSVGNKRTYSFIDPNSGRYSEAVTFIIPTTGSVQPATYPALAASPDLTKFAVSSTINGQLMAGWIDSNGQFTAVTTPAAGGAFSGNPPSYSPVGFDVAGNYYYEKNSQGAMHTEVYKVPAGSTSNAQQLTLNPPGAADQGGVALNADGSLLFGCSNMDGSWLNADTRVMVIAPGTQIAKIPLGPASAATGRCPYLPSTNEVPLLPATNTAQVHDPVPNPDGTKVAFLYDDPDRVHHNFVTVYVVGTEGNNQPTKVNLSDSDAKQLGAPTLLRWS
jgi:hypothetical protein